MTHANVNEIPTERLKDYASTNKNMLYGEKDGSGYFTAAEAQAFFDATVSRHDDLRAEHNRRKELKECPSNESISSLGSIRDHKYSEENFRDQDSNEPLHSTETEEIDQRSRAYLQYSFTDPCTLEIYCTDVIGEHDNDIERHSVPLIPCSCIAATFSNVKPRAYIIKTISAVLILSSSLNSMAHIKRRNRMRKLRRELRSRIS